MEVRTRHPNTKVQQDTCCLVKQARYRIQRREPCVGEIVDHMTSKVPSKSQHL